MLDFLSAQSSSALWLLFTAENFLVTSLALFAGWLTLTLNNKPIHPATRTEVLSCIATNIINIAVTYNGFRLWQNGFIVFNFGFNGWIIPDTILLLLGMDLLMYIFHISIHRSAVYKIIHRFHHHYNNPIPIDLFVLHPLETMSFGALWLVMISVYTFNFNAVLIYLTLNVVFGIAGHLGMEPLPDKFRANPFLKYLGTSSFHHQHHTDINYNFGFYTSIWDRLFRTYKP